jgi:CRP-like cAMP-binding protein
MIEWLSKRKLNARKLISKGSFAMSSPGVLVEKLKNFPIFEGLSTKDLEHVASILRVQHVSQGAQLIKQEQSAAEVFFIVDGRIRVEMMGLDGKVAEKLTTLSAGDTVGELALARVGRRTASAVAQMDSELYSADASALNALFETYSLIGLQVFRNLSKVLASRLVDTNFLVRNATAR